MPIFRCPQKLATRRERDCVQAAAMVEHGILPDEGGWQDQTATFVAAYPICAHEIQHWRRVAQELASKRK